MNGKPSIATDGSQLSELALRTVRERRYSAKIVMPKSTPLIASSTVSTAMPSLIPVLRTTYCGLWLRLICPARSLGAAYTQVAGYRKGTLVGNSDVSTMNLGDDSRYLEGLLDLLLLTVDPHPESVLPSLALLAHNVHTVPTEVSSLLEAGTADVAIVDARTDLAAARGMR